MEAGEDPGSGQEPPRKRTFKELTNSGGSGEDFKPFFKPNYKRLYPDSSLNFEFKVYIESANTNEKLGNKSPLYLNNIFTREVKGVVAISRVNALKIAVLFKQAITANNFLTNNSFLDKYQLKAYIPARQIEKTGIIRFVPTNISNEELYCKLSSQYEVIAVRRFTKKIGQERLPLQTVSLTFLSNTLPDSVQYDLFSYRIFDYVPPLLQCYKCFKYNHSAKICTNKQKCSICSEEHYYKECPKPDEIKCVNCSGPHLSISKQCPIKIQKLLEKKNKITYSSIVESKSEFPPLTVNIVKKPIPYKLPAKDVNIVKESKSSNKSNVNKKDNIINNSDTFSEIINNKDIMGALVKTLVQLGNKTDDVQINHAIIKDYLINNLTNNG